LRLVSQTALSTCCSLSVRRYSPKQRHDHLKAVRDAFAAHAVLASPAQELSADQQLTFARNFGLIEWTVDSLAIYWNSRLQMLQRPIVSSAGSRGRRTTDRYSDFRNVSILEAKHHEEHRQISSHRTGIR